MDKTWIKLYRKLLKNPIIQDAKALQVFIWILMSVDYKTGEMISGRFWAGDLLDINPNTYYKVLRRLQDRYNVISLSVTHKHTMIRVLKWAKFQADTHDDTTRLQHDDNESNTNQEIKNTLITNVIKEERPKRTSSCPLMVFPLNAKWPRGHIECVEYITSAGAFINKDKQFKFLHKMLRVGMDFPEINELLAEVTDSAFYKANGWDFATLASEADRRKRAVN